MKKSFLLFSTLTVFCSSLFAETPADSKIAGQLSGLTFRQIRNYSLTQEKADSIQTARLLYSVKGEGLSNCYLLIRAKKWDMIRFDLIMQKELRSTCINKDVLWGYDPKNGMCFLNPENSSEMIHDITFLPVPFSSTHIYKDPVLVRRETIGKTACTCYNTRPINETSLLDINLWLRDKTQSLHKIEVEDSNGIYTAMYRDYKTVNGVKMATTINLSFFGGYYTLKLIAADWNGKVLDQVFQKSEDPIDKDILLVRFRKHAGSSVSPAAVYTKRTPEQAARAKQLQKTISRLKASIRNDEAELASLKSSHTQGDAVYHSYWNGWGQSAVSTSSKSPRSATRRRDIRNANKGNGLTDRKFRELNQRLVSSRIALDEAQRELDSMPKN